MDSIIYDDLRIYDDLLCNTDKLVRYPKSLYHVHWIFDTLTELEMDRNRTCAHPPPVLAPPIWFNDKPTDDLLAISKLLIPFSGFLIDCLKLLHLSQAS